LSYFDDFAADYCFWIERINPPRYDEMLSGFLPARVDRALDAGCGPGHLAFYLADHASEVWAVDISGAMIAQARRRGANCCKGNLRYLVMDLQRVPLKRGTLDFVGSDCVLHDTLLEITVPALRDLLKAGGRMVIRDLVTPNPSRSTSALWQVLRTARQIPRYLRQFGPHDARRLLSFELSPAWVRQRSRSERNTPAAFQAVYSRLLPGCRFADYGWAMAALWQAPL
jgi:SAM-dependent methyltransferase